MNKLDLIPIFIGSFLIIKLAIALITNDPDQFITFRLFKRKQIDAIPEAKINKK